VLVLATLAAVTGAMHLDGLADTADGIGSRRPAEEALTIMKRSDIGPMGVAALVLVLLTDAAVATIGRTVYLLGGISREPLATIIAVRPR